MFNLKNQKVGLTCPNCGRKHSATLNDSINGRTIRCNCGTTIRLSDDGSVKKGINDIDKAMKDFEKEMKRLSH